MSKRPVINTVPSGVLSTNVINDNFNKITEHFDTVLSRDGSIPNNMTADLDMNGNQLLNLPAPVDPTEPLRKQDIDVDGLNQAAQEATQSAASALVSATNAQASATSAAADALTATTAVSGFTTVVDDATTDFNTLVASSTSDINTLTTQSLNDINTAAQQVDIAQTQINASTGILEGGILSGVLGGTTFDVSAGNGIILDNYTDPSNPVITRVTWPAFSNVTATQIGTGNEANYVFIDSTGSIVQKPTRTRGDLRDKIYIGLVGVDLTAVRAIVSTKASPITNLAHTVDDLGDALGPINISGNVYGPNGANLLVDKSAGEVFQIGSNFDADKKNPNYVINPSEADTGSFYFYRDGVGGWTPQAYTAIDPSLYDDGSGTLAATGNNNWTIIPIYMGTITSSAFFTYGQAIYATLNDAKAAISTAEREVPPVLKDTLLRGFIVAKGNATDLSDPAQAEFVEASLFGAGGGGGSVATTLQDAYDNSAEPEILTDSTRGALNLRSHSVTPADVFVIEENAGPAVTTFHNTGGLTTSGSVAVNNADVNVTGTGVINGDGSGITDVRSTDADNLVTLGTDSKTAVKATNLISADVDNGLSVGTDNKLYAAAGGAGGGAWEVLAYHNQFGAASEIEFTNFIGDYHSYALVFNGFYATATPNYYISFSADGGSTYLNGPYNYHTQLKNPANNSYSAVSGSGAAHIQLGAIGDSILKRSSGTIFIEGMGTLKDVPQSGAFVGVGGFINRGGSGGQLWVPQGTLGPFTTSTVVNAFKITLSTGSFNGGQFTLYGIKRG